MVISKKTVNFQGFRGGPTFSRGVQIIISIKTHITCDFPGGYGPLSPLWIRKCIKTGQLGYLSLVIFKCKLL